MHTHTHVCRCTFCLTCNEDTSLSDGKYKDEGNIGVPNPSEQFVFRFLFVYKGLGQHEKVFNSEKVKRSQKVIRLQGRRRIGNNEKLWKFIQKTNLSNNRSFPGQDSWK